MSHRRLPILLAALALTLPLPAQDLLRDFANPPASARPMVRWWWFGAAVEKPEILRELQQMKADGIGGVELAFVYPLQLQGNLPFLSPPMLDAVHFAQDEARKLGLRVDLTLCSGWPYGGPHIPLAQAATRLRIVQTPVTQTPIPTPPLAAGEILLSAVLVDGAPGSIHPATSTPIPTSSQHFTSPKTALFFIQSHTLQQVKRAAVGAEGFVLDPFSRAAVATHLKSVGEPLLSAFGSTPPTAIFSDSLEAYGADWTPTLPAEFRKRRGYDLIPNLPKLIAGDSPQTSQLRHDYGQTLTELVNENYLVQINDFAHAHHTRFRSQTYGEPAVDFSSQSLVDLPEGEGPQWRAFSTLRWATSANHVFGNPITSGETFTWLHSPVFRATPLDMKAEADIDFIIGENQLIFHGWPYSPPASQLPPGDPGWSLYAAAVFNDHNPWHPVMPAVTAYITRLSWLLRQGQPANQVAVLLPTDDAWATFAPTSDKATQTPASVTAALQKLLPKDLIPAILSAGYNFDFIDAQAINNGALTQAGVIPSQARSAQPRNPRISAREARSIPPHQILILPPTTRIPAATLRAIAAFQQAGGKVIALGHLPTLDDRGQPLPEPRQQLATLVPTAEALYTALHAAAPPDLQLAASDLPTLSSIGFIRRKLPTADIYFVTNTSNRSITVRAALSSAHKNGTRLSPDDGSASPFLQHPEKVFLSLAPYESAMYVFSDELRSSHREGPPTPLTDLTHDWTINFPSLHKTSTQRSNTDWITSPETLHYSGEAIYTRDFTLPATPKSPVYLEVEGGAAIPGNPALTEPEHVLGPNGLPNPLVTATGPGMHAYYDPPIHEAALVSINGSPAGALWHPPYRLDVTSLLKPGQNHIEIRVFNTALNAWSALPPRDYKPLIQKYGDRFQMQDLNQVRPIPSGLLGPIHLVTGAPQ